jgi:hypothetical protein
MMTVAAGWHVHPVWSSNISDVDRAWLKHACPGLLLPTACELCITELPNCIQGDFQNRFENRKNA